MSTNADNLATETAVVPRWVLDRCRQRGGCADGACRLCLAPLEGGDDAMRGDAMGGGVVLFPCGAAGRRPHAFHRECLDDWLARYADLGLAPTCPACRRWLRRDRTEAQPASPLRRWQPAEPTTTASDDDQDDDDDDEEEGGGGKRREEVGGGGGGDY